MPLHLHTPMPPLDGATEWIPSQPDFEMLIGSPILVYFWALSCHICHANLPKIQHLREAYGPKGLRIVSIHCPRMKTDVDEKAVRHVIEKYGIEEPVAIDNRHKVKKAFENQYWPAFFVFDQEGKLLRRAAGKNGLSMIEPIIQNLLD